MEKQDLVAWENKCIQDEAPACTSTCPIHVDVRLFIQQIAQGDWKNGIKTLSKNMPFPRILARICDHPCEAHCKRNEAGGGVSIGALERASIRHLESWKPAPIMAQKKARIAVVGSSLSSLTAAWDLLKKGYRVTVFEPHERLGGNLWDIPEADLPRDILEHDLGCLTNLKATVKTDENISANAFLENLRTEFDAVYVGFDHDLGRAFPELRDEYGRFITTPPFMTTSFDGVYAGGATELGKKSSHILQVLDGRYGANSIDRFLSKVAIEFGREGEGPQPTRLFTSLAGVEPAAPVVATDQNNAWTDDDIVMEARRCLQCECLQCVKVCDYLKKYKSYPKIYARQVYNNERVIFGGSHTKNLFVNSCTNCGLCEVVCPNSFSMGDLSVQARMTMAEQQFMPPSAHEFALQDQEFSNGEGFALCHHEPGKQQSAYLYFPSCQLCATAPGEVLESYNFLRQNLDGGVGILLGCCGAPAFWAGREALFRDTIEKFREHWLAMGRPKIITACTSCQTLLAQNLPELTLEPLWNLVESKMAPQKSHPLAGKAVAMVDPCASRDDRKIQDTVRNIASELGFSLEELPLYGELAECCGYGGLVFNANPKLDRDIMARRASDSERDYLAYCAMCRDKFVAAGKPTAHLVELLFPVTPDTDPWARGWLSWSQRRDNRAHVKQEVLALLGESSERSMEAWQSVELYIAPEVLRLADERRILESDLKKVVQHAEEGGHRLINTQTGYYRACHAIGHTTFWVDYAPENDGFRIHKAFSHRMKITGVH